MNTFKKKLKNVGKLFGYGVQANTAAAIGTGVVTAIGSAAYVFDKDRVKWATVLGAGTATVIAVGGGIVNVVKNIKYINADKLWSDGTYVYGEWLVEFDSTTVGD